jgi:hypothetical protein
MAYDINEKHGSMYSLVVVRFQGMNEKGQWFNMNA